MTFLCSSVSLNCMPHVEIKKKQTKQNKGDSLSAAAEDDVFLGIILLEITALALNGTFTHTFR